MGQSSTVCQDSMENKGKTKSRLSNWECFKRPDFRTTTLSWQSDLYFSLSLECWEWRPNLRTTGHNLWDFSRFWLRNSLLLLATWPAPLLDKPFFGARLDLNPTDSTMGKASPLQSTPLCFSGLKCLNCGVTDQNNTSIFGYLRIIYLPVSGSFEDNEWAHHSNHYLPIYIMQNKTYKVSFVKIENISRSSFYFILGFNIFIIYHK